MNTNPTKLSERTPSNLDRARASALLFVIIGVVVVAWVCVEAFTWADADAGMAAAAVFIICAIVAAYRQRRAPPEGAAGAQVSPPGHR